MKTEEKRDRKCWDSRLTGERTVQNEPSSGSLSGGKGGVAVIDLVRKKDTVSCQKNIGTKFCAEGTIFR